jgi:hypothetical protein
MVTAIVCIAKNEDNYIEEWIEYHLKLGFDWVYVYKNNWNYTINNPKVIEFDELGETRQMICYNNFISSQINRIDWAAFIDVDEFIVLKKHTNIKDFIQEYTLYQSIAMNWVFFGDNNQTALKKGVLSRFTKRQKEPDKHIKVLVKLSKNVKMLGPHNANVPWVDTNKYVGNDGFNLNGPIDVIQVNHYFSKTKEEFINKINRGRADVSEFRKIEEFDIYNLNEVTDFTALNFFVNSDLLAT